MIGIAKLSLLKKKASENYAPLAKGQEAHWEVVQRILFLYAKLNPGQSYVQGMNEIIGPIYYVFAYYTMWVVQLLYTLNDMHDIFFENGG